MSEYEPCGLGICAANAGHEGTCAEASGFDECFSCGGTETAHDLTCDWALRQARSSSEATNE